MMKRYLILLPLLIIAAGCSSWEIDRTFTIMDGDEKMEITVHIRELRAYRLLSELTVTNVSDGEVIYTNELLFFTNGEEWSRAYVTSRIPMPVDSGVIPIPPGETRRIPVYFAWKRPQPHIEKLDHDNFDVEYGWRADR